MGLLWGHKGFGLLLLVGGVAAIATSLTGLPPTFSIGLTILSWVALVVAAPLYAAVGSFGVWLLADGLPAPPFDTFRTVGFVWVGLKLLWYFQRDIKNREQLARSREVESQAKRRQIEFRSENRAIFSSISELVSCGSEAVNEIIRAEVALRGGADLIEDAERLILSDIARVLVSFRDPDAWSSTYYIDRLWSEIANLIVPSSQRSSVAELRSVENSGVKQLGMVIALSKYDSHQGTNLASNAASTYLLIISEVSNRCDATLATKIVVEAYTELLSPYIHRGEKYEDAGRSDSSSNRRSSSGINCQECADGLKLLRLPNGASRDEVQSQKRAFAELLHADRLGAMSERARHAAAEQHKNINAACDHILQCTVSGCQ